MKTWLLDVLACPTDGCGGRLSPESPRRQRGGGVRDGMLRCAECPAVYPVLGGVPILMPSPGSYLATYRESVLATLAEHDRLGRDTVSLVDAFAGPFEGAEPMRFGDDWVRGELAGLEGWPAPPGKNPATKAFAAFVRAAEKLEPTAALMAALGDGPLGTVLELGPGAGLTTRALAARAERLVVGDLSLRAVLVSLSLAGDAEEAAEQRLEGVVVDAHDLALRPQAVDLVVGANLVDLLEEPERFFDALSEALATGARVALTTPRPDLGQPLGDDEALRQGLRDAGFGLLHEADGVPWLRPHGPRYWQLYFAQLVVAERLSS